MNDTVSQFLLTTIAIGLGILFGWLAGDDDDLTPQ